VGRVVSTSRSMPNRSVEVVHGVGRDAGGTSGEWTGSRSYRARVRPWTPSDLRFVGAAPQDEPRVVTGADP
jgi:hypothetical protein